MHKNFSKFLKTKLQGQNLSQISRELDIPKTLLFEWKQAKRLPSFRNIDHVKKLADYFGITIDEMISESSLKQTVVSMVFEDQGHRYRLKIEKLG